MEVLTMKPVTWLLVLSIILTPCFVRASGDWQEFAVWPTTDEQEMPAIHGDIVVWQQFVAEFGDYDIYIADLNNLDDPLLFIIGDANDQTNPAIYENVVVWQDFIVADGPGDFDIRAADISDSNEALMFVVSDIVDNDERNPVIHGNIVVWEDGPAGDADVFGADITNPDYPMEFPIANFEFDQQSPAVHRTTVVWQDMYFGDWDILAADIWQRNKPADFGVSLLEHEQTNPAISGETIVWQSWGLPTEDNFPGNWDIYAARISEPNNPAGFPIATGDSSQTNPAIDGNLIVWQAWGLPTEDDRAGNWDIFGYNLTTRHEFQITNNPHDQTNPAISGTTVVWQDSRDGNSQIYAVTLDGIEVARCRTRLPGDINNDCKVDIADFALMASNWLECHLEPQQACPPR
jgi:beta propeller repeat protein